MIIPIAIWYEDEYINSIYKDKNNWTQKLENHLLAYPQQEKSPDYEIYKEKFLLQNEKQLIIIDKWKAWKEKYLKKGDAVFVRKNDNKIYKIKLENQYTYYEYPHVIETLEEGGYISYIGRFSPEKLYTTNPDIYKDAKNLIEAYGNPLVETEPQNFPLLKLKAKALKIKIEIELELQKKQKPFNNIMFVRIAK